jgi:predicted GIY-YIG superfamily endonuclease
MNKEFTSKVKQLPGLLERLSKAPLKPWSDLGILPPKGVYVFYENGKPLYVGRSDNMRKRLNQHGWPSSNQNKAPFAFNMAKKEAIKKGIDINRKREELERDKTFAALFLEAKARVSMMSVRAIEIDDPIVQTLFEVYASIALRTEEYNYFGTH